MAKDNVADDEALYRSVRWNPKANDIYIKEELYLEQSKQKARTFYVSNKAIVNNIKELR